MVIGNRLPVRKNRTSAGSRGCVTNSLDVRFDEYKNQRYYKLGQNVEEREIQTFFGLKKEKNQSVFLKR